jgi:uncharacterized membrane protein
MALEGAVLLLAVAALVIDAWLLLRHAAGGGIAGCSGACEELLASRWSQVFRVPVTVFAALAYFALLAAMTLRRWTWFGSCCGVIAGAALWFVLVQAVIVEYFDYQCEACRTMAGFLRSLQSEHPGKICVILLPVPLERSCNQRMTTDDRDHPGTCDTTRLAMAVWRTKPEAFVALHSWLMEPHAVADVRAKVRALIPAANWDAAMADPWIGEFLAANIDDWARLATTTRKLPKLLVHERRVLHGLPSGEAEFRRVIHAELKL